MHQILIADWPRRVLLRVVPAPGSPLPQPVRRDEVPLILVLFITSLQPINQSPLSSDAVTQQTFSASNISRSLVRLLDRGVPLLRELRGEFFIPLGSPLRGVWGFLDGEGSLRCCFSKL